MAKWQSERLSLRLRGFRLSTLRDRLNTARVERTCPAAVFLRGVLCYFQSLANELIWRAGLTRVIRRAA